MAYGVLKMFLLKKCKLVVDRCGFCWCIGLFWTTAIPQEVAAEPEAKPAANNDEEKLSVAGAEVELVPLVSPGLEISVDVPAYIFARVVYIGLGMRTVVPRENVSW